MSMKTKERPRKSTAPGPSFSKEGNLKLPSSPKEGNLKFPSSHEEGLGVVRPLQPLRTSRPGVKLGLCHRKIDERTGNVYENKGTAQKINHPWPLLFQGGESLAPLLAKGGESQVPLLA